MKIINRGIINRGPAQYAARLFDLSRAHPAGRRLAIGHLPRPAAAARIQRTARSN